MSKLLRARLFAMSLLILAAESLQAQGNTSLEGQWKGALSMSGLELVIKIWRHDDGQLKGMLDIAHLSVTDAPISAIRRQGNDILLRVGILDAAFVGKMNESGSELDGEWRHGMTLPLTLLLEKRTIDRSGVKPPEPEPAPKQVRDWFRSQAVPLKTSLPGSGFEDMQPLKAMIGDARIVSVGEATHGTREFFQLKHRMLEFLVSEMGFTIFGIEANWPESLAVNDYVLKGKGDPAKALAGLYFWTWNTEEVLDMIRWMRHYNEDPTHERKVEFQGFDMQTPFVAVANVLAYLQKVDPGHVDSAKGTLESLDSGAKVRSYSNRPEERRQRTSAGLAEMLKRFDEKRADYVEHSTENEWLLARQNLRIVSQAENMLANPSQGITNRDRHMAENVKWLLEKENAGSKVMLWAHNQHVAADASLGFEPMGAHLRQMFPDEMVIFGFAFYEGSFRALEWGNGLKEFTVGPATVGSLDSTLAKTDLPLFAVDLRRAPKEGPVADWLAVKQRMRQIGAVFSDETAHFFEQPIGVATSYDVILFVEKTSAARGNASGPGSR